MQQSNTLPSFQAAFAGVPATVQFAGLVQGYLGLYQFNVVVPKVAASDAVPFTFSLNGKAGTQTLLLPIGNYPADCSGGPSHLRTCVRVESGPWVI